MDNLKNLPLDWQNFFALECNKPYFIDLMHFLETEIASGKEIYPSKELWFNAFVRTPLSKIRCVIIGQDPYFSNPTQAHGLSFSVPNNVAPPPSLKNILKELSACYPIEIPPSGNLSSWADRGVFLLNASLTVESGAPGSHIKKGWLELTKAVIHEINKNCDHVVFLSWGSFAQGITESVDMDKHCIIKTTHPSPLGARRASKTAPAFIGSRCFLKANQWLVEMGLEPIQWEL